MAITVFSRSFVFSDRVAQGGTPKIIGQHNQLYLKARKITGTAHFSGEESREHFKKRPSRGFVLDGLRSSEGGQL